MLYYRIEEAQHGSLYRVNGVLIFVKSSLHFRFFILDFDKRVFYYTYTDSRQAQVGCGTGQTNVVGIDKWW